MIIIGTFIGNNGQSSGAVSDWILATGTWNDSGFWRDGENWID